MKVHELFEAKEEKSSTPIDAIAQLLFKKNAGLVTDPKRDKEKQYIGVAHAKSTIKDDSGKPLHLTFDNSTDSEDFEIDSLTPRKIEKGGDLDRAIKKLYQKHELDTKKKTGYVVKGDTSYLRELVLGKKLGKPAVKLVADLIKMLKGGKEEETEDEVKEKATEKKSKKKEK